MDQLCEEDKNYLVEHISELEFVDDVSDYCCVDCGNFDLTPSISDCGHIVCRDCKIGIYTRNADYHCPKCQATVINLGKTSEQFEKNLCELYAKCPNGQDGCRTQATLIEIAAHVKVCKHKKITAPKPETAQMLKMQEQMLAMMTKMEQMQNVNHLQATGPTRPSHITAQTVNPPPPVNSKVEELKRKLANLESQAALQPSSQSLESQNAPASSSATPEYQILHKKIAQLESQLQGKSTNSDAKLGEPIEKPISPEVAALLQKVADLERKMEAKKNPSESRSEQMDTSESSSFKPEPISIAESKYRGIPGKEYNILLLGQTGVGKSTFINAFCNYLTFSNLDEARNGKPQALIACQFTLPDENYKTRMVYFGKDDNENMQKGQSSTQNCKAYEFQVDNFTLRIIDTPGIGDTRGVDQDRLNLEGMLRFLTNYEELYAICILLKPNEARLTTSFAFCIKQLLCHLHHKASENIVFVFTNSRSTFYRPGDTVTPLNEILDQIRKNPPHPKIPFDKDNIFCLDNESFRFLIALQNGLKFNEDDFKNFGQSWIKSVEESQRMIRYIVEGNEGHGLTPHLIAETLSVNDARQAIINLAQPMSTLAKNIQMNIQVLKQRKDEIRECSNDKDKLKELLYLPQVSLKIKELEEPRTVCTGPNCRQPYNVGSQISYHYPQKCHDPCYLTEIPKEVIGADGLRYCWAIDDNTTDCHQCGCNYRLHLHIYYESEEVNTQVVDENIQNQLQTKEGAITAANDMITKLEDEIDKYKREEKKLSKYTAKLAVYLKQNAMVVRNDSFKEHLLELIENERSLQTKGSQNANIIKGLEEMLFNYDTEKTILDSALNQTNTQRITIQEVHNIIDEISNMKIIGINFKKLVIAQRVLHPNNANKKHGSSVQSGFGNARNFVNKGKQFFGLGGKH